MPHRNNYIKRSAFRLVAERTSANAVNLLQHGKIAEFNAMIEEWTKAHPGKQFWLINADLSGLDLNGANFDHVSLKNANLMGADLTNATIRDTNLVDASYNLQTKLTIDPEEHGMCYLRVHLNTDKQPTNTTKPDAPDSPNQPTPQNGLASFIASRKGQGASR